MSCNLIQADRSLMKDSVYLARWSGQPCSRRRKTNLLRMTVSKAPCMSIVTRVVTFLHANASSISWTRAVTKSVADLLGSAPSLLRMKDAVVNGCPG